MRALTFVLVIFISASSYAEKKNIGFDLYSIEAIGVRQSSVKVKMNRSLAPFKDHLLQYPFHNYRIKYMSQISVPVMEKEKFLLSDNESLDLRVLYCKQKRASLWINWKDEAGRELLDTRVHFNKNEPLIAGIEEGEFKGKLLLLKVKD